MKKERKATCVSAKTPNDQPHEPSKENYAEDHIELKPLAEKINAEEQAGFRAGRSTTEQNLNPRILCDKHLQHQQEDLYHLFIHFKKAFDRAWHAALRATMKQFNISTNLIHLYKTTGAVFFNGSIGD